VEPGTHPTTNVAHLNTLAGIGTSQHFHRDSDDLNLDSQHDNTRTISHQGGAK
jgi:hypothetical protein